MRGTVKEVNKSLLRPLLIAGVEKRLMMANLAICFPLVAATKFHMPACFIGIITFFVFHLVLVIVAKSDPHLGKVIRRSTRYNIKPIYPAKSHPLVRASKAVKTVNQPWG